MSTMLLIIFLRATIIICIFAFLTASMTDIIRVANSYLRPQDVTPQEKVVYKKIDEVSDTIEEHYHTCDMVQQDKKKQLSNMKMLIWLDFTRNFDHENIEEAQNMKVLVLFFSTYGETIKFMKYLFKLKPGLLSSKTESYFRILIKYEQASGDIDVYQQIE